MSHHQANRIRAKLAPFMSFLSIITLFFILASCGKDAIADPTNTGKYRPAPIFPMPKGTSQNNLILNDGLPAVAPPTEIEIYHGQEVSARTVILTNIYEKSDVEVKKFIETMQWKLIGKFEKTYQINIGEFGIENAIQEIEKNEIGLANADFIMSLNSYINDPYSKEDAPLGWALNSINARKAWDYIPENSGVKVGIIDGGFRFDHEDINFSRISSSDYDHTDQSIDFAYLCASGDGPNAPGKGTTCEMATHGMNVAGIISAKGNNEKGVAGVAWKNSIAPFAFQFFGNEESAFYGIKLLEVLKSKIINVSLGRTYKTIPDVPELPRKEDAHSREDTNKFIMKIKSYYPKFPDILIVQSAGNNGRKTFRDGSPIFSGYSAFFSAIVDGTFEIDADLQNYAEEIKRHVIIVGAFNTDKKITSYTSKPSHLELTPYILAPGGDGSTRYIDDSTSTTANNVAGPAFSSTNKYIGMAGTSQAAPHVSGVAALVLQSNPTLLATEVRDIILLNSDEIISDNVTYRALNAEKAVVAAGYKPFASFSMNDTAPRIFDTVTFEPKAYSENGEIIALEWDFGDGSATQIVANSNPAQHTYVMPGSYTVKLKVKDSKGSVNTVIQFITVSDTARTPQVAQITPPIATAGQIQKFKIIGTDLPPYEALNITFNGCPNIIYQSSTENLHEFTCVPQTVGKLTLEVRAKAGGNILNSHTVSVASIGSPPAGVWMGWNGSKYTTEEVLYKPGYITKANSNWSALRLRLNNTINGDNFSVEFRAKNDPALGGLNYRDMGFSIQNDFSTGLYDTNGNPRGTRQVTFLTRNGYSNDFFIVNSTAGDSGYIYQNGVVDNSIWHKYKFTVKNNIVTLHYDDALRYSQPFSGNVGVLDVFYIWGKMNVQLDTASMKFSTPSAPVAIEIPATIYINGENVALSANGYGEDTLMNAPPYTEATNAAEWIINIPTAGTYELFSNYAAAVSRPAVISFNGVVAFPNATTPTTGGWFPANRQVLSEGTVSLPAGTTRMRVARSSAFPHIHGFRLVKRD